MFGRPDGQDLIWKNQRSIHGQARVKSWKLLESCGVHIITFTNTQMILIVERRYPLSRSKDPITEIVAAVSEIVSAAAVVPAAVSEIVSTAAVVHTVTAAPVKVAVPSTRLSGIQRRNHLQRLLPKLSPRTRKKHLEIVPDEDADVYIEATPLFRKVPIMYYQIVHFNNKPHFKIIHADGTHQLAMFGRPDGQDLIWKNQRSVHGQARVKS
nr:hypothetical protein [Tanacetum cinerariifolium]GEY72610.1 hypothetical protein [Tanacetum cinerariifolium]